MEQPIRKAIGRRLKVTDIEYDIKRMDAEMEYHKAKSVIFNQAIQEQKARLDDMLDVPQHPIPKGEFYR